MNEADKIFKELGYKKYSNYTEQCGENEWTTQDSPYVKYTDETIINDTYYSMFIEFMIDIERIQIGAFEKGKDYAIARNPILNMQEIEAINLKCKELGWK